MEAWTTLLHMVVLLSGALVLGIVAEQLRQSAIVGYILAGMLIGPNVLGWVQAEDEMAMIAEIGAALLLFSIGLEFSFRRLRKLGSSTLFTGLLQIICTGLIGFGVARVAGLEAKMATAIGAIVALSSTACVLRVLIERSQLDSDYGRSALGILLLQDVAVVPLIILVTALTQPAGDDSGIVWTLLKTIGFGVLMVVLFYVLLNYILPKLLLLPGITRNRELPIILAAVLAVGSALTAHKLGMSASFGAFLAGLLLAESPFAHQIRADVSSLKTLLITLFFAAIGMFGDPVWIGKHVLEVFGWLSVTVLAKAAVIILIMLLLRFHLRRAVAAGLSLAQIGEFSFMLAGVAFAGGLFDKELFQLLIAITIVSLIVTPYLIWFGGWFYYNEGKRSRVRVAAASTEDTALAGESLSNSIEHIRQPLIIVGFGPAGQRVAGTLCQHCGEDIIVVDSNPKNARQAKSYDVAFHVGDARHSEVLEHLNVKQAQAVIVTVPDHQVARRIIQTCKALAPETAVVVRCRHHIYWGYLKLAGADIVIDEEDQIGKALADHIDLS